MDQRLKLTERVAAQMPDPRDPDRVRHQIVDLLRQRIYGLACGFEDLSDHDTLRADIAFQTVVEYDQALGSRSTLCRFEQRRTWRCVAGALRTVDAVYRVLSDATGVVDSRL